ncbi:MAG: ribosomal protein S18-alanine N-acetyltransferase [Prochlorococcus marinus CUG1438]|nr:ribosomal protein S18-alanine N-acetyltransferase [Prochlorococcus marinus CUG1438]
MISIKQINEKDVDLCYELDSNTISLWNKKQWANEFKKEGTKVFGLSFGNQLVGICVLQVVLDEAQINYFSVLNDFRNKGFGSDLMSYLIELCEKINVKKLILEVSKSNFSAEKFYSRFDFFTVGIRKNYYRDGSDALLKEKKLTAKGFINTYCADNQNA